MTHYTCGPQHPIYGISWKNIAKSLSYQNWKTKAIVRGGDYIWINRGRYKIDDKPVTTYTVFFKSKEVQNKNFPKLKDAIQYANDWCDYEGDWPLPWQPGWTISMIPYNRFPKRKKTENEPHSIQITGFGKEEKG